MATPINFSQLLLPGFRKIYGDDYKGREATEQFSKVFQMDSTVRNYEEDQGITTLGLPSLKPSGTSIYFDTANQTYTKRYTMETWGLGFIVHREAWEDALYRNMKNLPSALSRSVHHGIEIDAANILNRAFSSSYLGADAKQLCATDHPLGGGGGTFSNTLTTPADLDIVSIENMILLLAAFVDDRNMKYVAKAVRLIIPPQLEWTAKKILGSDLEPGNANNDINPAKGLLPSLTMDWLTDPDAWFIQTDAPVGLTGFWRRKPEFSNEDEFNTEVAKFKATYRTNFGWTDPRCIVGTAGA